MELEGRLTAFPLPEVLQFLAHGKMTGILSVSSGESEVRLEIRDGKIVNSSTMDRPNKVGEMLARRGVVPRSQIEEALEAQHADQKGRLIGQILVERGRISEEQLRNTIQLQVEEDIWGLFGWRDGEFKFEHGDPSQLRPAIAEIEIGPLLLEDSQRWDEWKIIVKTVPDNSAVFGVAPPSVADRKPLALQEQEWEVLRRLNGRLNVGSIIASTGFSTFETYRILNTLVSAGLAARRAAEEGGPTAAPAGEALQAERADEAGAHGPEAALDAVESGSAPARLWRVGGFLGRRWGESEKEEKAAVSPKGPEAGFVTPVGLCGACLNDLMDALGANPAFAFGERDRNLLGDLWWPIVNSCPKADLLAVRGNHLDVEQFEAFAAMADKEETIQGCYEDAMEALGRLFSRLCALASQRLGGRNAQRLFASARDAWPPGVPLRFHKSFQLSAFMAKAMA